MARSIERFKALSPVRQAAIVGITAWNVFLTVAAERDIHRRPATEIRGSKALWRLVSLTNTVGPLAYFRWGRRSPG